MGIPVIIHPFIATFVLVTLLNIFKLKPKQIILIGLLSIVVGFIATFLGGAYGNLDTGPSTADEVGGEIQFVYIFNIVLLLSVIWWSRKHAK